MNGSTSDTFATLFGQPSRLYFVVLGILVVMLSACIVVLIRKGWRDRNTLNDVQDIELFFIVGRILILVMAFTAIFNIH